MRHLNVILLKNNIIFKQRANLLRRGDYIYTLAKRFNQYSATVYVSGIPTFAFNIELKIMIRNTMKIILSFLGISKSLY